MEYDTPPCPTCNPETVHDADDTVYEVVITHEEHGELGTLDDTFDTEYAAGHAAFDAQVSDVGITADVVPVSDTPDTAEGDAASATLWTDGASRGNPGPAAGGVVLELPDGNTVEDNTVFGTDLTNNEAEYRALQYGVSLACAYGVEHLDICLDSELVVKQLTGEYSVSADSLIEINEVVTCRLGDIDWDIEHVPREDNKLADELANEALDAVDAP